MKTLIIACLVITGYVSYSQSPAVFIENKGQWDNKVKFKTPITNGAFFLREDGFTVVQHNSADLNIVSQMYHLLTEQTATSVLHSHAYEVTFLNAMSAVISQQQVQSFYNNYFMGNDPAHWTSNCKVSSAVLYKNLYEGIDLQYYSVAGAMKYDIIILPNASASAITMEYKGVDGLTLSEGKLLISTSAGTLQEYIPYSYTIHNGVKNPVQCSYSVSDNKVRFDVGDHNPADTMVIDPQLTFSTYTGSTSDNWANTATYGADGSFYSGSIVFGTGFPVTTGAYQTTFSGGVVDNGYAGYDMAVMKFNPTGSYPVYATYLGGSGNEVPFSMITDAVGNLIITGRSNSPNYPVTLPLIGSGGSYDIFITKLNSTGSALAASRTIGGSGLDGLNIRPQYPITGATSIMRSYGDENRSEVALDVAGNIILASCTQATNFPTTAGAFQPTFGGGLQDGVIIKLNGDLSTLIFSSFIGGQGDDGAFSVAINPVNNNIYLAGSTTSYNMPGVGNTSVINSSYQGGVTDGYISIINATGSSLLTTSYIGTSGNDMLYLIRLDLYNYPYITGNTTGNWYVSANATFSQAAGKQFISKLQPDLSSYVYSTTFGKGSSTPDVNPIAFGVDYCENVYVAGWGGTVNSSDGYPSAGTTGLTTTAGSFQSTTDGSDFYFFVLNKDATSQKYGTFFGRLNAHFGDHTDGGTNRFNNNGVLYMAACDCSGGTNPFPTTPGSWSVNSGNANLCNLAAVKFDFGYCAVSMPVRFNSFNIMCSANKTKLKWSTSNEQNASRYEVEKNAGNNVWTTIASVLATNKITGNNYEYSDAEGGIALYRLKQFDIDGKYSYSSIIASSCSEQQNTFKAFPIPARDLINVSVVSGKTSIVTLQIGDITGRVLSEQQHTIQRGNNLMPVKCSGLAKGNYILKVIEEQNIHSIPIIIGE